MKPEPEDIKVESGVKLHGPITRGGAEPLYPWKDLRADPQGLGNSFFVPKKRSKTFASAARAAGVRMGAMFVVRNSTREVDDGNGGKVTEEGVRVWRIK